MCSLGLSFFLLKLSVGFVHVVESVKNLFLFINYGVAWHWMHTTGVHLSILLMEFELLPLGAQLPGSTVA